MQAWRAAYAGPKLSNIIRQITRLLQAGKSGYSMMRGMSVCDGRACSGNSHISKCVRVRSTRAMSDKAELAAGERLLLG
jgi:hypothetical protein